MFLKKIGLSSGRSAKLGHTYLVQWIITVLCAFIFLGYGFNIGWVSPLKKVLKSDASPTGSPVTDLEMTMIASSTTLAAILGSFLCLYVAEVYGRKKAILIMTAISAIGWILQLSANHVAYIIVARICAGIPVAGSYCVIPIYVKEISQDSIRGLLMAFTVSSQYLGVLAIYTMGGYLGYYITLWIILCYTIVAFLLMLMAPESPSFLVKVEKYDEATKVIATLRRSKVDDVNVVHEINLLKSEDSYYKTVQKITYSTIFKNKLWRRIYTIIQILMCCIALNGTFGIMTYAWSIMTEAGVSVSPELLSLLIPLLMIVSTLVPILSVEKIGRKVLLIVTLMLSAAALGCLASLLLLKRSNAALPSWISVVCIAVTVSSYSGGVLPMATVIMNETFRFQIRARLISCIHLVIWLMLSLQLIFFDVVTSSLGLHSVFFACAGVNLFAGLLVMVFLPETKGLTTDQIEAKFANHKSDQEVTPS